jgi:hypothetical protein
MRRSEIKLGEEYAYCPTPGRWNGAARVKVVDLGPFVKSGYGHGRASLTIDEEDVISYVFARGAGGRYVAVRWWQPSTSRPWAFPVFAPVVKLRTPWRDAIEVLTEMTTQEAEQRKRAEQLRAERDAAREREYREREELTQLALQAGITITASWHTDGLVPLTRDQFRTLVASQVG